MPFIHTHILDFVHSSLSQYLRACVSTFHVERYYVCTTTIPSYHDSAASSRIAFRDNPGGDPFPHFFQKVFQVIPPHTSIIPHVPNVP